MYNQEFIETQYKTLFNRLNCINSLQNGDHNRITSLIKDRQKDVDLTQIYVIFAGAVSCGKTTMINSLLGQDILPSYTQQFVTIKYSDQEQYIEGPNGIQNYPIEQFDQFKPMDNITVYTRSQYHKLLPTNIQSRLVFVDSPGFNLSTNAQEYNQGILKRLDDLTNTDRIIPIVVWVMNSQQLEVELELQKQLQKLTTNTVFTSLFGSISNISQHNDQDLNKSIGQLVDSMRDTGKLDTIGQQQGWCVLLNKYDYDNIDYLEEKLENVDDLGQIGRYLFRISAKDALRHIIMNGTDQKAKDNYINSYYQDYQFIFQSYADAEQYIIEETKNNQNLIKLQDHTKFQDLIQNHCQITLSRQFYNKNYYKILALMCKLDSIQQDKNWKLQPQQAKQLQDILKLLKTDTTQYQYYLIQIKQECIQSRQDTLNKCLQNLIGIKDKTYIQQVLAQYYNKTLEQLDYYNTASLIKLEQYISIRMANINTVYPDYENEIMGSFEFIDIVGYSIMKHLQMMVDNIKQTLLLNYTKDNFRKHLTDLQQQLGNTECILSISQGVNALMSCIRVIFNGTVLSGYTITQSVLKQLLNEQVIDNQLIITNVRTTDRILNQQFHDIFDNYTFVSQQLEDALQIFIDNIQN